MNKINIDESTKNRLINFTKDIVSIPSYSSKEKNVVERIKLEMTALGYDDILIDGSGSIIGVMGNGPHKYLFDSHIDTVEVTNEAEWTYPPFSGEIHGNKLYGRGASDMKASAAASVYAGYLMKKYNLLNDKTIYICCSALEEDYDGEGTYQAIVENNLSLDGVIICEPTHLRISMGQRGRSVFTITTHGISSHGAAPERGVNAVYKMSEIINRVNELNRKWEALGSWHPTIVLSKIESRSVSLNAVPDECTIYLDLRSTMNETEEVQCSTMDELVSGIDGAHWDIYDVNGYSYLGNPVTLHSLLPAWEIDEAHPLAQATRQCYLDCFGENPEYYRWDFSTNGVATAGKLNIPTIGFGAGIEKMAHQTNEYCPVDDIWKACEFYAMLPSYL